MYIIFHLINKQINRNGYLKIPLKSYLSKFKEIDKELAGLLPLIQDSVYSSHAEGEELFLPASQPKVRPRGEPRLELGVHVFGTILEFIR